MLNLNISWYDIIWSMWYIRTVEKNSVRKFTKYNVQRVSEAYNTQYIH